MHILGISCFYHDAAAALLRDGVLIAASEEERFSRVKHDFGFPGLAIEFCLKKGGIESADLDGPCPTAKPGTIAASRLAVARSVGNPPTM